MIPHDMDKYISYNGIAKLTGKTPLAAKKYILRTEGFPPVVMRQGRKVFFDRRVVEAFLGGKITIKEVKTNRAIEFLAGLYDNPEARQQHSQRLAAARLNKPATQTVRVIGDCL